ncbi:MAG: hypothetical protein ACJ0BT_02110 [Pseudohongiellaceae bacterium]
MGKDIASSFFLPVCFLLNASLQASAQDFSRQDYLNLITEYVYKIENIYDGNWAFTYTIADDLEMESRTIRRDTSLPFLQSETLLAINGMPPSEERLQKHAKRRQRTFLRRQNNQNRPVEDEEEGDEKERFLEMIIPESVHFLKQEDELLYIEFQANEAGREKLYEKLQGVLILDTEAQYIKELQVIVTESFSLFLLSEIESGYFSLRFNLHNGVPMQSEISFELQGHAFFIRDLSEDREVEWTDIERI